VEIGDDGLEKGHSFVSVCGSGSIGYLPYSRAGFELSHTSCGNKAQLILADVSLGEFWPSCPKGPLLYLQSVGPGVRHTRTRVRATTLTARLAAALFHDPAWSCLYQILG